MFNVAARRTRRESDALSISRVDSLIGLIRNIDNGIPQEGRPEIISRKVLPRDYKALLRRLESSDNDISGFFHSALRYVRGNYVQINDPVIKETKLLTKTI